LSLPKPRKKLLCDNHYLSGLASRPFLLNKIAFSLPALKQLNHINSTSLYQALIEDTLRRDDEKHVLSLRHKKTLLQDLAYYLWQNKEQVLPIDDLMPSEQQALCLPAPRCGLTPDASGLFLC
jgi:hypothetical protein